MTGSADLTNNWWVFPGFELELVAKGLDLPVNISFVPNPSGGDDDPLLYVTELYGQVKAITNNWQVHTYAEGLLNFDPGYKFPGTGENGLIGICVEPESGDLFLSMNYLDSGKPMSRVIRTKSEDGIKMDSAQTIIEGIPSVKAAHQIQALKTILRFL